MKATYLIALIVFALSIQSVAATLTITDVEAMRLTPGKQGTLTVTVLNDFQRDVEDVSFSLNLEGLPITSVGSSEDSVDEIEEDETEKFSFTLRASPTARPGDYNIPYTLSHGNSTTVRRGTIGITVDAETNLDYSISVDNPVVGENGKINLKIINLGEADARFLSLRVEPSRYTILSEDFVYVGTVSSDDFETATFDVVFTNERPRFIAEVTYKDQDNQAIRQNIELPVPVYTREKALELGIIKQNNTGIIVAIIVLLIIFWFIWRSIEKRRRMRRSMQQSTDRR